ncbi:bifunctional helix-turn-helix transcriptional regulator/GNAT family N-acetyltransferase [Miltoncostaea marina]|uniref:bifunctional helix-turn-helix transcriptional regulator/GNAT family N-acetyltransferase n=1 Tax=Miltoncostaea marina TaxID=2843215 RepID=UPI001C3DC231|nr:bifunctional helix-turn-helix transcriptional regulator/GNAT family N-acetyltransferase [Miltoncostaea marina]
MPDAALVEEVRRSIRAVTARAGALDDRFLGRGRPLGAARLLWEIGDDGAEVRDLRARLGLDSGYLSRLLRALEGAGLVVVAPSERDRRRRTVRLTGAGRAERRLLDERADERARAILAPLRPAQRRRLADAMREVARLLDAGAVETRAVDPLHADARRCLDAYFAELDRRSGGRYDPAAGESADPHELRPPDGLLLVAYLRGAPVGCGAVKHPAGRPAEIKRMWVDPSARGLGIGARLLDELERRAAAAGAATARLETSRTLTEAIAMYRRAGYAEVPPFNGEPFADHWFEKRL